MLAVAVLIGTVFHPQHLLYPLLYPIVYCAAAELPGKFGAYADILFGFLPISLVPLHRIVRFECFDPLRKLAVLTPYHLLLMLSISLFHCLGKIRVVQPEAAITIAPRHIHQLLQ